MAITISVLDQSPIYPGETPEEAFQHTIKLAQLSKSLDSAGSGFQSIMTPSR